ncbi:NAD(P)(+)--arginine ADP-ribosyltransferase 1-like [Mugil cephalus]|uniref:NAD(P)(+)--arginine ADP-ribosyltransferase 1-like n=1 Tax=Mugil cephalus TaxID=48193 RepID=UPI001FB70FCC|nr:NAD(P)(+)--arginine ADP-ribosyltransferase 1-like [Mugil cephalus]XP_047435322.1 NAD(P)(+)--arginine ADP-ribosyltransferase 1-like [Mugil cephalus]XP_047435323.1 NAD(P)(+)--arginine ADP-ribosyltransferase 1-like [Mugil cephalus]XP_047435324.1 NAD(P)(+)--arginine ADP-ribosyltransferase 1-like [Mugil cephalus]XP_047435325.1 NAD(P)(+)--arginine ADP-ribosyltransferase 1-like [Mugil cephalus]XP_047435326.1 NAD(P)(+)--arginine ADP-ribosyltransferase 1-like [Mugil cephalus]
MWDVRKLVVAAIIFTAVYDKLKAAAKDVTLLQTPPDRIHGLYIGCPEEAMEKIILSGLLEQELNQSVEFQKNWSEKPKCSKLIPGGKKEHTAALSTYNTGLDFMKTFNNEMQRMAGNFSNYEENFHFKSLHFLLLDSMRLLKPKKCKSVYILQDENRLREGTTVRFEHFTTASSNFHPRDTDMADMVLLNITSCFFVDLNDQLCLNNMENNILLSPAEVFTVERIKDTQYNDDEYTEVTLKHSELDISHSCHVLSRSPTVVSTLWVVSGLVVLSLFL